MSATDKSKPGNAFWVCAGLALILIAGATAFRIAKGSDVEIDGHGISIKIAAARQQLEQAAAEVSHAQAQLQTQSVELQAASTALAEKEARLNAVYTRLQQHTAATGQPAPPQLRAELAEIARVRPEIASSQAVPATTFSNIEMRLRNVATIENQLKE